MTTLDRRRFILDHTRLQRLPLLPEIPLYLADQITPLWEVAAGSALMQDAPPPYWAVAWVGGQAVARYVLDHPGEVSGRTVIDLAAGCGLCAIAAMRAGATAALASDIDPLAQEAVALNAEANGVAVLSSSQDLLGTDPPELDLVLAGDVCYEKPLAGRAVAWMRAASKRGARVLIGDPGRHYFPRWDLILLAEYRVPTTRELEGMEVRSTGVFTL